MEERFDKMLCPNCGKEMGKGITNNTLRDAIFWYPGREAPKRSQLRHLPDARKCEDPSEGVNFDDTWDIFVRTYRPSWYCHECGLLLLDTKILLSRQ